MFSFSSDAAYLSPEIQLEIWRWAIDAIGMPITVILLIVVLVLFFLVGRKVYRNVSNSPRIKGDNNIVGNKTYNTYFINPSNANNEHQADTTPLSKRDWLQYIGDKEHLEKTAGFKTNEPIYYTIGSYPRYYILHTYPRVFNWDGENHYDASASTQYFLLEESADSHLQCKQVDANPKEEQRRLKNLYKTAQQKAKIKEQLHIDT